MTHRLLVRVVLVVVGEQVDAEADAVDAADIEDVDKVVYLVVVATGDILVEHDAMADTLSLQIQVGSVSLALVQKHCDDSTSGLHPVPDSVYPSKPVVHGSPLTGFSHCEYWSSLQVQRKSAVEIPRCFRELAGTHGADGEQP